MNFDVHINFRSQIDWIYSKIQGPRSDLFSLLLSPASIFSTSTGRECLFSHLSHPYT